MKSPSGPADLSASEALERLASGALTAEALTTACLDRIAERDGEIGAWTFVDRDLALGQARAADRRRTDGQPLGALDGIPVGVKDIVDTADLPTENGTVLDARRRPSQDATIVARLRSAGAVILGKTVTTECAYFSPGKTRNPRALDRTPGGSSSGSAAAVAAAMVPLAIGTQTFGSVIRPASFCGVVGFKPTFGLIPRTGVLPLSRPLDTVGVFGRTVTDAALIAEALAGYDPGDADSRQEPPPRLVDAARAEPPPTPSLAFVATPEWDEAEPAAQAALTDFVSRLGDICEAAVLPPDVADWQAAHRALMRASMAHNLQPYSDRGKDRLSDALRELLEEGMTIPAVRYLAALDEQAALDRSLQPLFDRYDAILAPAAPGEAPLGLAFTGNPIFNGLWTLCGTPAVTLPLLEGANGLPIGVQLVGRRGEDGRLLRTARWLADHVAGRGGDAR